MGLRYRLTGFRKSDEGHVVTEYSRDFGEDHSVMDTIGISICNNINNGEFDVEPEWIPVLQPLFNHVIEPDGTLYFIAFDYRDEW